MLVGIGVAIFVVYGFVHAGAEGAATVFTALSVNLTIGVVLGVIACFITAKLMDISFGSLNSAMFKLAAIFLFPTAVSMLFPWVAVAWLVSFVLYFGLLTWLFELEGSEPIVCAVVIWVVRVVAFWLGGNLLAG